MPSRFQKQLSPCTSPAAICEGVGGDNVMRKISARTLKKAQQKLADVAGLLRWVREHCQPKVEFMSHVPNTVSTGKWLKQIMQSTPPPLPSPADGVLPPPPPQWLAPLMPEGVEVGCVAPCMANLSAGTHSWNKREQSYRIVDGSAHVGTMCVVLPGGATIPQGTKNAKWGLYDGFAKSLIIENSGVKRSRRAVGWKEPSPTWAVQLLQQIKVGVHI